MTKYLSPGEFLTTGIDTTETYSCISSDDKSFTIDGVGVTMSFDTVTTSGDVKLDYYDPANVPAATANADGSVSISLASTTGTTIGSIIDLSLETAVVTGDITITLPYLEANIKAEDRELVGAQWNMSEATKQPPISFDEHVKYRPIFLSIPSTGFEEWHVEEAPH